MKTSRPRRIRTCFAILLTAATIAFAAGGGGPIAAASGSTTTHLVGDAELVTQVKKIVRDARRGDLKGVEIAVSIRACDDGGGPEGVHLPHGFISDASKI